VFTINDSNSSHYSTNVLKPKGFGQKKEDRIKIPVNAEWQFFKESLEGATDILSEHPPGQAKITSTLVWYRLWVMMRPEKPTKGERRIAQQICADYLGVNRFEFIKTSKALTNAVGRFSLGGVS
jgi:hypothetical protein